ncbi:c-Myc-binding protein-like [Schistocerca piceifrons]|uniref:c-Myc-binding protein-like n=1 Tax=Schistocerca piceifrons TaxID=274613 RepID=UPI001F5EB5FC|nr:c-Myc-binding protein-like [Schistocerca piceifrons]
MASIREVVDEKREEFRQYLERGNVMMSVTRALVSLYDEYEKPEDPVEYVRKALGDIRPTAAEMESVRERLKETESILEELRQRNDVLRGQLLKLDPDSELLAHPRAGDDLLDADAVAAYHSAHDEVVLAPPPTPTVIH